LSKGTTKYYCTLTLFLLGLLLVGCSSNTPDVEADLSSVNTSNDQVEKEENTIEKEDYENEKEDESSLIDDTNNNVENNPSDKESTTVNGKTNENFNEKENDKQLDQYSSKDIEYARVWLQLGPNQDIDALYVTHILAGTLLNPDDETSISYPEDVIQLAGSRLVDGSVTYSSNEDGTINVYKVPLRWDVKIPAGEKFYKDIIENTELVYVDPGEDNKVIQLIKKIKNQ
jgi:hypothetical protein